MPWSPRGQALRGCWIWSLVGAELGTWPGPQPGAHTAQEWEPGSPVQAPGLWGQWPRCLGPSTQSPSCSWPARRCRASRLVSAPVGGVRAAPSLLDPAGPRHVVWPQTQAPSLPQPAPWSTLPPPPRALALSLPFPALGRHLARPGTSDIKPQNSSPGVGGGCPACASLSSGAGVRSRSSSRLLTSCSPLRTPQECPAKHAVSGDRRPGLRCQACSQVDGLAIASGFHHLGRKVVVTVCAVGVRLKRDSEVVESPSDPRAVSSLSPLPCPVEAESRAPRSGSLEQRLWASQLLGDLLEVNALVTPLPQKEPREGERQREGEAGAGGREGGGGKKGSLRHHLAAGPGAALPRGRSSEGRRFGSQMVLLKGQWQQFGGDGPLALPRILICCNKANILCYTHGLFRGHRGRRGGWKRVKML